HLLSTHAPPHSDTYTLSLHDALPISMVSNTIDDFPEPETPVKIVIFLLGIVSDMSFRLFSRAPRISMNSCGMGILVGRRKSPCQDRKSTRLNSSHSQISYAVFCLKKK